MKSDICKGLPYDLVECARAAFKTAFVGAYLHGSAAMGCFNPNKSDLDIVFIVDGEISDRDGLRFMRRAFAFDSDNRAPAKGLEFSVVQRRYCKPFIYPTPYELHYSRAHADEYRKDPRGYVKKYRGADKDLAAHFSIIIKYGIVLYGASIADVFAPVPRDCCFDSIFTDVVSARNSIADDAVYYTLNLCRAAAFAKDGLCLSKYDGGKWGLANLPSKYSDIISEATHCYTTDCMPSHDSCEFTDFADYMIDFIKNATK